MERGLATLKTHRLVQKSDQVLVWYDGQIARMLDLQEFRTVSSERDNIAFKCLKRGTNFHSLARDVEQERTNHLDNEKTVLLEKTNQMDESNKREESLVGLEWKGGAWWKVKTEMSEHKLSAFKEVYRTSGLQGTGGTRINFMGSAFSPVPARLGNKTSTLFKSSKSLGVESFISDTIDTTAVKNDLLMSYDFLALANSFLPTPEIWPKSEMPNPPQVLPPTFTTLGSTAQIWCAKCRLSFRMTSDLVLHMRSRHKERGGTILGKRPRELQLSCPVCYAYFRERHHLSRHMTSHC
ncbi:zinc finger protein 488 [Aquarana catesbeiana]|uniref:zinc finger protein 488 n=1 Tax=Aquarana catesbeiana TaxID=8400 RepID=UPI003CC9646D